MPADPNRLKDVFLAAADLAPAARPAFLAEACDPALRPAVERLLAAHDGLPTAAFAPPDDTADHPGPAEDAGTVVAGRYHLLEAIGEGGMGSVWMAEQREPVRRLVALKLIKPGMDSRQVLARFEAERQALALMDHPSIAKVLDGGTTDRGRPYFVMELVKGLPLTAYCDDRRLSVRQRLELFVQICSAVQHAHQKGVIHRDLKPSNVLVTEHDGRPVPKVIDFGLAKALHGPQALTDKTLHTAYGAVVGTPLYMAPEQVGINALDVDTRADIYALGVILYELLTGTTPLERKRFGQAAWDEMKRLIREEEPPRPSVRLSSSAALPSLAATRQSEPAKLSRLVRGELDWIVMKALEKDRNRRYETANGFAMDVGRHLAEEPVLAVPPSAGYRARKFVRRHKGQVVAASLVLFALLAGVVGTTLGLIEAKRQERLAVAARAEESAARQRETERADGEARERQRADAARQQALQFHTQAFRALQAATGEDVGKLIGSRTDLNVNEREYLEAIIKRWQGFARESGSDDLSRYNQAVGHYQVANLRRTLGHEDEALAGYRLARDLQTKLVEKFPDDSENLNSLALTHNQLGLLLKDRDQWEEARVEHLAGSGLYERLVAQFPTNPGYQDLLAAARGNLGLALRHLGKLDESRVEHVAACDLARRLVERFPADPQYQSHLAADHSNLGIALNALGRRQEGLAEYQSAFALRKALAERFPAVPRYQHDLAISHVNIGLMLDALGRTEEALTEHQAARDRQEKLVGQFPAAPEYRGQLQMYLSVLGGMYTKLGRHRDALAEYQAARDLAKKLVEQFPRMHAYQIELGGSYCNCGMAIRDGGEPAASLDSFDTAIRILTRIHEVEPGHELAKKYLRNSYWNRAVTHDRLENIAAASADWERAWALSPPDERPKFRATHANLAMSRLQDGKIAEAVAAAAVLTQQSFWTANEWYNFACVYAVASGKIADTEREYADRAMELLRKAVQAGYTDAAHMRKDADLDPLRERADFQALLAGLGAAFRPEREPAPRPRGGGKMTARPVEGRR